MPSLPSQPFAAFHTSFSTLAKNFAAASLRFASVQFVLVWFGLVLFSIHTKNKSSLTHSHTNIYGVYVFLQISSTIQKCLLERIYGLPSGWHLFQIHFCVVFGLKPLRPQSLHSCLFCPESLDVGMSEWAFKEPRQSTHIKCRTSEFGFRRSINCKLPAHKGRC